LIQVGSVTAEPASTVARSGYMAFVLCHSGGRHSLPNRTAPWIWARDRPLSLSIRSLMSISCRCRAGCGFPSRSRAQRAATAPNQAGSAQAPSPNREVPGSRVRFVSEGFARYRRFHSIDCRRSCRTVALVRDLTLYAQLFAAERADRLLAKADLGRIAAPGGGFAVPSSTTSLAARQRIRPDVSKSGWDARHPTGRATIKEAEELRCNTRC
jgi:hypothetical protein